MSQSGRPRPRIEGNRNPALPEQESQYGDSARVVPKKMGMRAVAARRLLNANTRNIYRKSNQTTSRRECNGTLDDSGVELDQ